MNTMLSRQLGWMHKEAQDEARKTDWLLTPPATQRSSAEIYQDEVEERCFIRSGN